MWKAAVVYMCVKKFVFPSICDNIISRDTYKRDIDMIYKNDILVLWIKAHAPKRIFFLSLTTELNSLLSNSCQTH